MFRNSLPEWAVGAAQKCGADLKNYRRPKLYTNPSAEHFWDGKRVSSWGCFSLRCWGSSCNHPPLHLTLHPPAGALSKSTWQISPFSGQGPGLYQKTALCSFLTVVWGWRLSQKTCGRSRSHHSHLGPVQLRFSWGGGETPGLHQTFPVTQITIQVKFFQTFRWTFSELCKRPHSLQLKFGLSWIKFVDYKNTLRAEQSQMPQVLTLILKTDKTEGVIHKTKINKQKQNTSS